MANFNMIEDDDFADIFVTQWSHQDVSLEEDTEYKSILDPKYSDISDTEEEQCEERIRYSKLFMLCSQNFLILRFC